MQHIFILGAYGQNNLGDDALLEVFLDQFAGADILVNSAQPAQTRQRYGVRSLATYWSWPRLRRPRALLRSDLIVFGGGSLLKEVEGGLIARLLYFVRIFAILLIAKLAGRPTAMLGVGIGPLERPLYRRLSRWAAELTDLICVRDSASHDLLRAIGVRHAVHVTADPVFTLTTDTPSPIPHPPSPIPHPPSPIPARGRDPALLAHAGSAGGAGRSVRSSVRNLCCAHRACPIPDRVSR